MVVVSKIDIVCIQYMYLEPIYWPSSCNPLWLDNYDRVCPIDIYVFGLDPDITDTPVQKSTACGFSVLSIR